MQEALRCWDAAIEQARAEGQIKWASALVNRRHAAKMADRYGIDLPPPNSR